MPVSNTTRSSKKRKHQYITRRLCFLQHTRAGLQHHQTEPKNIMAHTDNRFYVPAYNFSCKIRMPAETAKKGPCLTFQHRQTKRNQNRTPTTYLLPEWSLRAKLSIGAPFKSTRT